MQMNYTGSLTGGSLTGDDPFLNYVYDVNFLQLCVNTFFLEKTY